MIIYEKVLIAHLEKNGIVFKTIIGRSIEDLVKSLKEYLTGKNPCNVWVYRMDQVGCSKSIEVMMSVI